MIGTFFFIQLDFLGFSGCELGLEKSGLVP